ncbi:MAG TPA: arginine deiminase family protein [Thermoanaerobaculia bacterium]|nr:arginine deiminase family protein [Thermoanaerobaculia bacterium]
MRLNVTSEIGRLKSVLVHLPGREIDLMVPPMMAQLLFDDILYGQVAREEHRRFQQLIRFVADDVLDLQDLLEEVLEDEDVKDHIIRDLGKRNRLKRKLIGTLLDTPPAALAEVLISGIARETESGELPQFDLYPIPNLFFMRDPQVVIGDRVVVSAMATQARRRESLLSKYVFENHPHFKREEPFWVDFMESEPERPMPRNMPTIEGGDILIPRRDLILVGITERTNKAGVEALLTSLRVAKAGITTAIVVDIPRQRSFMHLDTIFTFINRHECLLYPPVLLPSGSQAAKVTMVDLTKKRGFDYSPQKSLLAALKKQDFDLEPIYCGGKSAIDQQREQWTDGANAFALAPGIILLYERNVRTAEALAKVGYHIVYEDDLLLGRTELETWTDKKYALQIAGNELSRARGGPRCMTMPLEREEL